MTKESAKLEPVAAIATKAKLGTTRIERFVGIQLLNGSQPKNFEETRLYAQLFDKFTDGFGMDWRPRDDAEDEKHEADPVEGVSRKDAATMKDIIKAVLNKGQTPGITAMILVNLYDKLESFEG